MNKKLNLEIQKGILINLDVLSYKDRVIKGDINLFKNARIVIMEASFEELYENQPLFDDVYFTMKNIVHFQR